MRSALVIAWKELKHTFLSPIAYAFLVVYVVFLTFMFFRSFFLVGQASMANFFDPWVPMAFALVIPGLTMRMWAEERKQGTLELLLTLPVPEWSAVVGKFVAAWAFAGIALVLTFPVWITVNVLGEPDNGVIVAGYLGSFVMAGGFLAIGSCISALTKSQVIAFVLTVVACFALLLAGFPPVLDAIAWAPAIVRDAVASFSFLTHFSAISRGVIDARDVVFFSTLIAAALFINALVIELRKAA